MPHPESPRGSEARHGRVGDVMPAWWFWVLFAVFVVSLAGMPLWSSSPAPSARAAAESAPVLLAVALGGSELRRRYRGDVRLPRVRDCPSVRWVGLFTLAAVGAVYLAIVVSVHHGHRGEALGLVGLAAVLSAVGTPALRRAMRADLEAGRVGVMPRPLAADDRSVPRHAPGDRVVWLGAAGSIHAGEQLVYAGTFVADGPAPLVTVRFDGAPGDGRVKPARLFRERDYLSLVRSGDAPPPTSWG